MKYPIIKAKLRKETLKKHNKVKMKYIFQNRYYVESKRAYRQKTDLREKDEDSDKFVPDKQTDRGTLGHPELLTPDWTKNVQNNNTS